MLMRPVRSSDLCSVGYEAGELRILFNSGGLYSYEGVPASVYEGLMSAPSHGRYFHRHVKGRYPYRRIG